MKKTILYLFLIVLVQLASAQNDCPYFKTYMDKGNAELAKGNKADFNAAINAFSTAMTHCQGQAAAASKKIQAYFKAIDALRTQAERDKQTAQNALVQVEQEKQKALAAQEKAEARARRALANELAFKGDIALREGDRTTAFRLAEFAYRYIEPQNNNAARIIHDAHYYNDHPERLQDNTQSKSWNRNFLGHTSSVRSVTFSPNGQYSLSGSCDGTMKLWEVETNLLLEQHRHQLAALSPQQIKDYDLIAAIDSTQGAWARIVAAEGAMQLRAFGIYYVQEVANNNNPDIFNIYYEKAEQCYQRASNISYSPAFSKALDELYHAWGNKLLRARDCVEALSKVEAAYHIHASDASYDLLKEIYACLEKDFPEERYET